MDTNKMIATGKDIAIDHIAPALAGVLVGQFVGKYRFYFGLGTAIYGMVSKNPKVATAGAVCAVTPLASAATGTAGFDGLDGSKELVQAGTARIKSHLSSMKEALMPWASAPAPKATGTAGLGEVVYGGYDSPALAGGEFEGPQLLGNLMDFDQQSYAAEAPNYATMMNGL